MISRSSPIARGSWSSTAPTSSGWRTSPTSPSSVASRMSRSSWTPGRAASSATGSPCARDVAARSFQRSSHISCGSATGSPSTWSSSRRTISDVSVWRVCVGRICHRGVCVIPESRWSKNRSNCNMQHPGLARHGGLPDASREDPMLRSKPATLKPNSPHAAGSPRRSARRSQPGELRRYAPRRRPSGRTSMPASRANDQMEPPPCCSGKSPHPPSLRLHECGSHARPKDAKDKGLRERWSRGRSVASWYNESRPHMALKGMTPAEYALQTGSWCGTMRLVAVGS